MYQQLNSSDVIQKPYNYTRTDYITLNATNRCRKSNNEHNNYYNTKIIIITINITIIITRKLLLNFRRYWERNKCPGFYLRKYGTFLLF